MGAIGSATVTLHCYVHGSLTRDIQDWIDVSEALDDAARDGGFQVGAIVVEAPGIHEGVPDGLATIVRTELENPGAIAVAVPHLGHLQAQGDALAWRMFVERLTGRPLIVLRDAA
ncbi:hypothetical protein HPO96_06345 [Kribbella sandramycini]|uniref:Uncharacterized protein n=1 Tax=Kribbella sandramycini TaxID=60450 RepID=A0A7Y4NZC6_9ACTN|nr:hypothetical protein [Kribbella sandramycini]MBB6567537.1 hypothetical protein [Kribbella sandramycini]NOL39859.1 hypothetical protein [Kribbella sandramycini]